MRTLPPERQMMMSSPNPNAHPCAQILDRFALSGKVAVVTGASSGLGVAFSAALASAGADVVLGARRPDRLAETQSLIAGLGKTAVTVATDVTQPEDCERLAQAAIDSFGRLDILINNAGVASSVPALRETPAEFRNVFDTNLFGAYWMAQACAAKMSSGGSIVNVSSVLGLVTLGLPQAAYSASKGAVIALTRDLAQQWTGRKGIRVNAVVPGFFPSEMTDSYENWDTVMKLIPMGRLGDPVECASLVVFLASEAASYVTGSAFAVDGGLLTW
jgi:NAD(P)-dependent dehydrogenase (short-subunit alcohol dehydrogenase family)